MRTPLDIDDDLLKRAKQLAAREQISLTRLIEEGLAARIRNANRPPAGASGVRLPPPQGYETWLDYAVATFDTRSVELERLFADDDSVIPSRVQIRQAAEDELRALRRAGGVRDTSKPRHAYDESLTSLSWKPEPSVGLEPTTKFPEDVTRLVRIASEAGYSLPRADAELVWREHSDSMCAGWLVLGDDDAYLLRVILQRTEVLDG